MLTSLHILLTYRCPLRCKHCYVFGDPRATGTFTTSQVRTLLYQAAGLKHLPHIIFEGGEPFSVFPLLLNGIRQARRLGFEVSVITNGFFARDVASAKNFLRPLKSLEVAQLWVSDDNFHYRSEKNSPARQASQAAEALEIAVQRISVREALEDEEQFVGKPVSGTSMIPAHLEIRGRAAENYTGGKPEKPWEVFTHCPLPHLDLPEKLYIDAYGNLQVCQGITIGNIWEIPLPELVASFLPAGHSIWHLLLEGGPALLAEVFKIEHSHGYLQSCHLCYCVRRKLLNRFPNWLAPRQVYGL
jgi:organic radical activating enzyme